MGSNIMLLIWLFVTLLYVSLQFLRRRSARKKRQAPQTKNLRASWVSSYLSERRFDDIVKRYRQESEKTQTPVDRMNLLGLASLYDQSPDQAIEYFGKALGGAVGKSEHTIKDNLACAYLQKGWYEDAYQIMQQLRNSGHVVIVTYVLTLLMNNKLSEARAFYELNPISSDAKDSIETLLRFHPQNPASLEAAREVLSDPNMYIYHPFLPKLLERWDQDVFFEAENRYELLAEQCQILIQSLAAESNFFQSPLVRYMRSTLMLVSTNVKDYQGALQLYGVFNGLDTMSYQLPISTELQEACATFWRRVYLVIHKTVNPNYIVWESVEDWVREQLPSDAKQYPTESDRCDLYFSPSLQKGIRVLRQFHPTVRLYAEFISQEETETTLRGITPLVDILANDKTVDHVLEPLIFSFVYDVRQVTVDTVHEALLRLPNSYRVQLQSVVQALSPSQP